MWISVKDKLPEVDKLVIMRLDIWSEIRIVQGKLLQADQDETDDGQFVEFGWETQMARVEYLTHWMEIPPLPKE